VRRDNDVIELEQRVVGLHRFLLEDIQAGAGDLSRGQCSVQRCLVHDRTARRVDQVGTAFHEPDQARADQAARLLAQRAVDAQEVRFAEQGVHIDQPHAECIRHHRVRNRVVRDELHVEWFREAKQFGADVADTDGPQRAPGQAGADVVHLLAPSAGAREPVLDEHLLRQHQHEGQRRSGDRTPHAIWRNREQHAGPGAGRDVDAVVTDAETRDQLQPPVRARQRVRRDTHGHGAQGVVPRRLLRSDIDGRLLHVLPLDQGVVQHAQHLGAEDRHTIGLQHIGGDADPKLAHGVPPEVPARSLC
jgi:hypothetical protein